MRIRVALNLLFLKYSWCFFNEEQYESTNAESNIKEIAKLPCNKVYFTEDGIKIKTPTLVMWFKFGISSPIYSVDFRNVKEGKHWSAEHIFGSRAVFNVEESYLSIERVEETDAGQYKCRIDFEKFPTKNYVVNLQVIVPPKDVRITDPSGLVMQRTTLNPVIEGQPLQLICTAYGGKPAPRVLWWQNEVLIDNQSEIIFNNEVKNILHFDRVDRRDHGSVLKCEAVNGEMRNAVSKLVVVNLHLRPLGVRLLHDHEIFSVGKEYNIICLTYGSRPPANITWILKGTRVNSSLVETAISADENVTTSTFKYRPFFHEHGSKLTCKTINNYVVSSVLSESWILFVRYAPIVKVDLGRNLVKSTMREGVDVYFDCNINANPAVKKIAWTHNGRILLASSSGVIMSNQTLVLQSISKQSSGNYCCVASNLEGETQSEPYFLNVKYEPVCRANQQVVYGATRLEQIEIVCHVDANPSVKTFIWKFNNSLIRTKDVQSFTSDSTYSVAMYQPKNELDYGTLLCWAKNELGMQRVPCVFHIIPAGKPESPNNCSVSSNVTENVIRISCESGFDGGLPQEFVCEVFTNSTGINQLKWNITNRRIPEFTIIGLDRDLSYVIRIYSSNGKGRSVNRILLRVNSLSEMSEKHIQTLGWNSKIFSSLWTITLSAILIILLGLLVLLIISAVKVHGRPKRKQKKKKINNFIVTPIHSDDERNPDVIPQIEEIHPTLVKRLSTTVSNNQSHIKQFAAEMTSYNTFPNSSFHLLNYSSAPMEVSNSSMCESIVQWIEPKAFLKQKFCNIVINPIPSDQDSPLLQHVRSQAPVLSPKESAV